MDDSANELRCFLMWPLQIQLWGQLAPASFVPYRVHTTPYVHSPCAELGFSTPHSMIQLDTYHGHANIYIYYLGNGTLVV